MNGRFRIPGFGVGYAVTGKPRRDGKIMFQVFMGGRVWRSPDDVQIMLTHTMKGADLDQL